MRRSCGHSSEKESRRTQRNSSIGLQRVFLSEISCSGRCSSDNSETNPTRYPNIPCLHDLTFDNCCTQWHAHGYFDPTLLRRLFSPSERWVLPVEILYLFLRQARQFLLDISSLASLVIGAHPDDQSDADYQDGGRRAQIETVSNAIRRSTVKEFASQQVVFVRYHKSRTRKAKSSASVSTSQTLH